MKKRILCYGDSNTWGYNPRTGDRYDENTRWTALLGQQLGEEYVIIEEGLNGRTAGLDDPFSEGLNGYTYLFPCLCSQAPLDLMIVMLGTNDCKDYFRKNPKEVMMAVQKICAKAKMTGSAWRDEPHLILTAPAPVEDIQGDVAGLGNDASAKSKEFAELLKSSASKLKCTFINAGDYITAGTFDGVHLDEAAHRKLAEVMEEEVRKLI